MIVRHTHTHPLLGTNDSQNSDSSATKVGVHYQNQFHPAIKCAPSTLPKIHFSATMWAPNAKPKTPTSQSGRPLQIPNSPAIKWAPVYQTQNFSATKWASTTNLGFQITFLTEMVYSFVLLLNLLIFLILFFVCLTQVGRRGG